MRNFKRYCKDYENIENYEKAKADDFKNWEVHHRLETHNSDGERRLVDITADELKTAMQNREVYLAEVKKRQDEYAASKSAASAPAAAPAASTPVQTGGFTF